MRRRRSPASAKGTAVRWGGVALVCLVLAGSCRCGERVRRIVSNPTEEATRTPFDGGSGAPASRESEPNDAPENAQKLGLGGALEPVRAEVSAAGDVDWYALENQREESWLASLTVEPTAEGFDPRILLAFDGAPGRSSYNVAGPGRAETIPTLAIDASPLLVAVEAAAGTGEYSLQVDRKLSTASLEAEPNDIRPAAASFAFPGAIEGFYDRPSDVDFIHSPSARTGTGIVRLSVTATGEFGQTLEIGDGRRAGSPYLTLDVPAKGRAELPNFDIPDFEDGLWFRLESDGGYSRSSSYRLRGVEHPPVEEGVLEAEPNDEQARAQAIGVGQRVRGYLHRADDRDHFRLYVGKDPPSEEPATGPSTRSPDASSASPADSGSGPGGSSPPEGERRDAGPALPPSDLPTADAGIPTEGVPSPDAPVPGSDKEPPAHVVRVAVRPARDRDDLELIWSNPRKGGEARTIASPEEGAAAELCNVPIERGTLELAVRGADDDVDQIDSDFDYELVSEDVAATTDSGALEIEPNDRREQADALRPDEPRTGYISGEANDADVYAFAVPETRSDGGSTPPRPVRIRLTGNQLNLGFELVDSHGGVVARVDRNGAGSDESTSMSLPPGIYYVEVTSGGDSSCRPYVISFSLEESAPD